MNKYVLDSINVYPMWRKTKGKAIKVGIIDTGCAFSHPDLVITASKDFTGYGTANDDIGHGTHVAGILGARDNGLFITGVAPECDLYIAKMFSKNNTGKLADCIRWLTAQKVDVINMSLYSYYNDSETKVAVKEAFAQGVIMVACVGNDQKGVGYPAAYPEVIAITAVDQLMNKASFSNMGAEIDVAAPGLNVESTFIMPKVFPETIPMSGTSMATPVISGVVALFIADFKSQHGRKPTLAEVKYYLHKNSIDLGEQGKDAIYGFGFFRFPGKIVELWIGKNEYLINGKQSKFDVKPALQKGRTMLELRDLAEKVMGVSHENIDWDCTAQKVTLIMSEGR